MMLALAGASLLIWSYLLIGRGGFWLAQDTDREAVAPPAKWPDVIAIVPARDEAEVISDAIRSLLAQDYPGDFRVILVDDGSSDGTAEQARAAAAGFAAERLEIVTAPPTPRGWAGKIWAMAQGVDRARASWLWMTDADIVHAPDALRMLVSRAVADGLVLHSLMARLHCRSLAERGLIPAFVFFFQMIYPFARVNSRDSRFAAAAGGCMLVNREALARAGGLARIAREIIDDCHLGRALKDQGAVRLSLTSRSVSIRPYEGWRDIGRMIARSAYAQLNYSPLLLAGTMAGLALVFLAPPVIVLFGTGGARLMAAAAWGAMAVAYQPMLRFYRRSPLWGLMLPAIAAFYAAATMVSAADHRNGRGGMWKGRVQADLAR